jgi:hypothetical protein
MIAERKTKESIEFKNEGSQQSSIWNISSLLSNIFTYADRKDLLEFSTVCKKWNHLTNPIIHKNIKLNRNRDIIKQLYGKGLNEAAIIDAEVAECIFHNRKHAPLVKEFNFSHKLDLCTAIKVFATFRFINILTIEYCTMNQDQFLGMVSPLAQLQELTLSYLRIRNNFNDGIYNEAVQLPSSLKKLRLGHIGLIDNPELYIQTINSHNNLLEFSYLSETNEFFEPFYKPYPSLVNFEYTNQQLQSPQHLIKIFEQNPQIATFKLSLQYWNTEYVNCICRYLINLEDLDFIQYGFDNNDYPGFNFKFSQPTKIKKLNLERIRLSNFSLNSILENCSDLEELNLRPYVYYKQYNYISYINPYIYTKIKKLSISYDELTESVFSTLLSSCPYLNEITITLPYEWRVAMKSIYENYDNLERLEIRSPHRIHEQDKGIFLQEFYNSEFFTNIPKCKSTLTHLTLKGFNTLNSKSAHFKKFKCLKSINCKYKVLFG